MHFRPFLSRPGVLLVALLAITAAGHRAQGEPLQVASTAGPDAAEWWARGVSPEAREKAIKLRNQGRALAQEFQLTGAVKKYREALEHWNHPIFHYDLCRILNALDRPLEAYASVKQALRHGAEPLGHDEATRQKRYQQMLAFKAELERRLVLVEIKPHGSKVDVSVDNHIVTPGEDDAKVLTPGRHRMAAQGPGHWPLIEDLHLAPGTTATIYLVGKQPIASWKPWLTLGVGGALTVASAGLYWHAIDEHHALERSVKTGCTPICTDTDLSRESLDGDWRRIRWQNRIGLGGLIAGGSVLLTGTGLVLWNQQRKFELVPIVEKPISITPVVSPALTGVVGTLRF
jgi:hypothetical protein